MVQEEMKIKVISYLQLWSPFCSAERSHLCRFDKKCITITQRLEMHMGQHEITVNVIKFEL